MRQNQDEEMIVPRLGITPVYFTVLHFEGKVHFAGAGKLYDQAADCLASMGLLATPGHLLIETERFLMEGPLCETCCIDHEAGELGKYKAFPVVAGWLEVTFMQKVRGLKWRELFEFQKLAAERAAIAAYLHARALYNLKSMSS